MVPTKLAHNKLSIEATPWCDQWAAQALPYCLHLHLKSWVILEIASIGRYFLSMVIPLGLYCLTAKRLRLTAGKVPGPEHTLLN
jgi:hypothetical protein